MSTRCTIWYDRKGGEDGRPSLHLFSECFDDSVWLEIDHGPFRVTVPLPQEMVKAILASDTCKQFSEHGGDTSWVDRLPKP